MLTKFTKPILKQKTTRPELKGSLPHQLATDPFLDWVIILSISLFVSIALVGVGIKVYFDTESALSADQSYADKKTPLPLDESVLTKVINQYSTRSAEYSAIRRSAIDTEDPSLP